MPAGAKVTIDELEYGQTPVTIPMKRDAMRQSGKRVTLRKDGYQDKAFNLQKEFNYVRLLVKMMLSVWMRVGPITIHRSHREDGAGSA